MLKDMAPHIALIVLYVQFLVATIFLCNGIIRQTFIVKATVLLTCTVLHTSTHLTVKESGIWMADYVESSGVTQPGVKHDMLRG